MERMSSFLEKNKLVNAKAQARADQGPNIGWVPQRAEKFNSFRRLQKVQGRPVRSLNNQQGKVSVEQV